MSQFADLLSECRDCGLVQRLPPLPDGATASCRRCRSTLRQVRFRALALSVALATLGLVLIGLALVAPLVSVSMRGGRFAVADVWSLSALMGDRGRWDLGTAVGVTLWAIPAIRFAGVLAVGLGLAVRRVPVTVRRLFAAIPGLTSWAMIDVFLLGATIALVRLNGWMAVHLQVGLLALGGAALCSLGLDRCLDRPRLWKRLKDVQPPRTARTDEFRHAKGVLLGCSSCWLVSRGTNGDRCPRCHHTLHHRKPHGSKRTWALLAAAALLALPANLLPVLTLSKVGTGGTNTIIGGTIELVEHGFWPLAVLVFVASILIPLIKIAVLAGISLLTSMRSSRWLHGRTRLYRALVLIGRWSMLDVFATATLVALARFAWVGSVEPEPGLSAFAAVVVLTILATESFDPRSMWDASGENSAHSPGVSAAKGTSS